MRSATDGAGAAADAGALEADLAALGIPCTVEARERLALVVPRTGEPGLADPELRREAVRLAEARGFSHVALELAEDESLVNDDHTD